MTPKLVGATDAGWTFATYANLDGANMLLALRHAPFSAALYAGSALQLTVNKRGLTHFEHRRNKDGTAATAGADAAVDGAVGSDPHHGRRILDWGEDGKPIYADEDGDAAAAAAAGDVEDIMDGAAGAGRDLAAADPDDLWEERFQSHTDSKPHGPTSVGVDVTFEGAAHVYGIPEHATSLNLKSTDGSTGGYSEPYRLYNLDVFEYDLDVPAALYGSIPFMMSLRAAGSAGVFWNNPTELYVDVARAAGSTDTRWIAESGAWDLFLFPGPGPKDVLAAYTRGVTGTQAMPPAFALGYHQCRWNYRDEADVLSVDAKFEELNFPYDVLWLDIEHTDGKRYFTWDKQLFPNPAAMQEKLAARGRKMVTIVDPHIKRDTQWDLHKEATANGYYIKNKDGADFAGWCWPGDSSYLDFTSAHVRSWWADRFALDKYTGSTVNLYTWNDMNEPSVFNGPEVSMNKDAKSLEGVEHREWHNLYGLYQQWATGDGQRRRVPSGNTRPFVLSRAFFAGSQRHGAIWTGDNFARWDHLAVSAPMLLSIGVAGLTFAGADVGGFFKDPDAELLTRWYQAGSWQPFFRAHSHIETKRREPWLFGDDTTALLRGAVRTRYTYLPLWYTLFHEAHTQGTPVMRPLWAEYPQDAATYDLDDQWLVGSDILVAPVTSAGQRSVSVYFPGAEPWYDVDSYAPQAASGGRRATVDAPLDKIAVYQRGGSIVPRLMRPRRCSSLMGADPYTLVVALDSGGNAQGSLYLDDGSTFDYQTAQAYRVRKFRMAAGVLTSTSGGGKNFVPPNTVERIVILGVPTAPRKVVMQNHEGATESLTFLHDVPSASLVIRKPDVAVAYDFTLTVE